MLVDEAVADVITTPGWVVDEAMALKLVGAIKVG